MMNNYQVNENEVIFDCGCSFHRNGTQLHFNADLHDPNNTINFKCHATYKLLQDGLTEGIFQLNKLLGKQWCKKVLPSEMEHISALGSILRPGALECVSADTKISIKRYEREKRKFHTKKITAEELFRTFKLQHINYTNHIVSYNEDTQDFFDNRIVDVYYKGKQDIYKVNLRIRRFGQDNVKFYKLKCTLNHPLLVHNRGWIPVSNINKGDRIAVVSNLERNKEPTKFVKGEKTFANLCFYNYEYKCVMCDWKEASLDVNHLEGNRKTNNEINNLCFLCPNHHRMYHEDKITKEEIIQARKKHTLKNTRYVYWAEFDSIAFEKHSDVYDIEVEGPYHNFIAGNFIVHNCKDENNNSITVRYERKKNGKMELTTYHPIVDAILAPTYGENIYQEQAIELVKQCAGFSLAESDILRKGIGKKLPEVISQCKKDFMNKGKELGIFNEDQLKEIFGWIEASQRYQFNHSHAWSYGLNSYVTAYIKAHFPLQFYKDWLRNEDDRENYINFVNEAKLFNIEVKPPDLRDFRLEFYCKKKNIYFGLTNIKGLVKKDLDSLAELFANKGWAFVDLGTKIRWLDFLCVATEVVSSKTAEVLIKSGALDCFDIARAQMLYEYDRWNRLTPKEKTLRENDSSLIELVSRVKDIYEEDYQRKLKIFQEKVAKRADTTREYKTELKEPAENRRLPKLREILQELDRPLYNVIDTIDSIIFAEEDLLGVALTRHKTEEIVNAQESATCIEVLNGLREYVVLRVKVEEARQWQIKNGKSAGRPMCFLQLSDKSGRLPAIAFADCYEEFQHLLTRGSLVFVSGQLDKDTFVVKRVYESNS